MLKQAATYKHGDRLQLKRNDLTSRGIGVCNSSSPTDFIVSAGEIGAVTRTPYTAHDGSPMASWTLEFTRGRRIPLKTPEGVGYAEAEVAGFYPGDYRENLWKEVK